ncbi:MAG TPA: hypothetical protein VGA35_08670 [bacterium]
MRYLRQLVVLVVLSVVAVAFGLVNLPTPARAATNVIALAGPWQAALLWSGSGCGPMSGLVNFTLDKTGTDTKAILRTHGPLGPAPGPCGDNTSTETFQIITLNPNGSGTAGLTCGPGCGWVFTIQVYRDHKIFNMVDVASENPGNFVEGTAIQQGD